eukprot:GFYU01002852.1.p1 GENE.GFYU01002852.1~~GFYU01002852.1.p1  ORF type:complete len:441 (+),score=122.35 GFYU01002852.1:170-1492(+)
MTNPIRDPHAAKLILWDRKKREPKSPAEGYTDLARRLKAKYRLVVNTEENLAGHSQLITPHPEASVLVLPGPREMFSTSEFETLKEFLNNGGSILVTLGEGGEKRYGTNINYFLEEFGINVNNDCVVRTVYYKYPHPKEVQVSHGVVNKGINKGAGKIPENDSLHGSKANTNSSLKFVYPYGATLQVEKPAIPILSSGQLAFPLNRPIGAVWDGQAHNGTSGRLVVLGSNHIFDDQWIDKEDNAKLQDVLFRWLVGSGDVSLDEVDAQWAELAEHSHVPETAKLAERLRTCLQESEELPRNYMELFDESLFKFDTSLIPEAIDLYEKLGVKHEPLSLIPPQFETPLPPLQPAVFPPTLREPPPPALDLLDLDEHFASERVRLAHLTNKCTDEADLEYYVREAGEILGVTNKMKPDKREARHVLEHLFKQIATFKKMDYNN